MQVSRRHLAEVIGDKTLSISDGKVLAREIAAYLLDTKQVHDLDSLIRDIMEYRAQHGIVEAVAVSANDLSNETVAELEAILKHEHPKAKKVHVITKQDSSVVGGVRLEMANEELDLTIRDKIDMFKRLTAEIKD